MAPITSAEGSFFLRDVTWNEQCLHAVLDRCFLAILGFLIGFFLKHACLDKILAWQHASHGKIVERYYPRLIQDLGKTFIEGQPWIASNIQGVD